MAKKKSAKSKTKHGFAILSDRDDLETLWSAEKNKFNKGDDFAGMFEESLKDSRQIDLLQEKKETPLIEPPLSKKELLKEYPPVQKILDLHGHTGQEAYTAAGEFIQQSKENGLKTLLIIVGKGHHSNGEPVIPGIVEQLLFALKRKGIVLEFEWEKKDKRKSGSAKVFLS